MENFTSVQLSKMADNLVTNELTKQLQRNLLHRWSLKSAKYNDVYFMVGRSDNQRIIGANKLILSLHSDVFEAMLMECETAPDSSKDQIQIPDVNPDAFVFLVEMFNHKQPALPFEILIDVMYAAKKYMVDIVSDDCTQRLKSIDRMDDVFKILLSPTEYARSIFDEAAQAVVNGKFVKTNKMKFLEDPRFLSLRPFVVKIIVGTDALWLSQRLKYESIKKYCIALHSINSEEKYDDDDDGSWQSVFATHFQETFPFDKLPTSYLFGTVDKDKVLSSDGLLTVLKNKCMFGFKLQDVLLTRQERDRLQVGDRVDCRSREGPFYQCEITCITQDMIRWKYVRYPDIENAISVGDSWQIAKYKSVTSGDCIYSRRTCMQQLQAGDPVLVNFAKHPGKGPLYERKWVECNIKSLSGHTNFRVDIKIEISNESYYFHRESQDEVACLDLDCQSCCRSL